MNEQASLETESSKSPRWWWWLLAGLIIFLLIWLGWQFTQSRPLKPVRDTAVPLNITLNSQAVLVNFDALNDDPAEYANKRVRVSGNYLRLEPVSCAPFSGPRIEWGLVSSGLQLNARGFEAVVLPIVPANTQMTVEGVWRRYPGPAGCGKEPPSGLWYLDVEQIVQPNPLVAGTSTPVGVLSVTPPPFTGQATATVAGSLPPAIGTPVPIPNVTIVSTVVVNTPVGNSTPISGTAVPGIPTATSTVISTATQPPGVGTATAVPGTQQPTNTPTMTPTPSSTPIGGIPEPSPTTPVLVTATPGSGYPGPTTVPPPTSTPESYP